jgi:hypothetical protein
MNIEQADKIADNSYQAGKKYFAELFKSGSLPKCSTGYISGSCNGGHRFASPYLCGKDYCKECGKDGSPIHARRVSRWLPLVQQFKSMGYLVVTFPEEVRFLLMNKRILSDFRYQLKRKLLRDGYASGLARWHWFGDCHSCEGMGCFQCDNTGSGKEWHPHLNIFLEEKYITDLEGWKAPLQRWVKNYITKLIRDEIEKRHLFIEKLGGMIAPDDSVYNELDLLHELTSQQRKKEYVINYSYTSDQNKIVNRLKYVTRSTFRVYNDEIKNLLFNYRNSIRWGFDSIEKDDEPVLCDKCLDKGIIHEVRWHKIEQFKHKLIVKQIENGIYRIHDIDNNIPIPPGGGADGDSITLQYNEVRKRATANFSYLKN